MADRMLIRRVRLVKKVVACDREECKLIAKYEECIGFRLTKTSLTLINRTRLRTQVNPKLE